MNIWDILILTVIGLMLWRAVKAIRSKDTSCCSSSGGCSGCSACKHGTNTCDFCESRKK